jgi:hypothetical protein
VSQAGYVGKGGGVEWEIGGIVKPLETAKEVAAATVVARARKD